MLRCVGNPANPSGMRSTPSLSRSSRRGSNIPRTASAEGDEESGWPKQGPEKRKQRDDERCTRVERDDTAPSASFRVELSVYGLSEIVSCGRASTPYIPPNIAISSASQFAEHSSTSGTRRSAMPYLRLRFEIFAAR
ncbi:hypothetical protein ACFW04_009645 [Cataglyphis niger]